MDMFKYGNSTDEERMNWIKSAGPENIFRLLSGYVSKMKERERQIGCNIGIFPKG